MSDRRSIESCLDEPEVAHANLCAALAVNSPDVEDLRGNWREAVANCNAMALEMYFDGGWIATADHLIPKYWWKTGAKS